MASALLVRVRPARRAVRWTRLRFDPSARRGIPPHITVLYPFVNPRDLNEAVVGTLREIFAGAAPFRFSLAKVAWFGSDVAYLAPEPRRPFEDLTARVREKFPEYLPYGGAYGEDGIAPHLTLGKRAQAASLQRAAERTLRHLPIDAVASEVLLMAYGTKRRRWHVLESFPLDGRPVTG